MAGPVPVATVLGCDPVSHRSCAVMVRGRSRIRYENSGEKYSPIIISAKQTLQTIQTIKQFKPKTNILIFVKTGLLQVTTSSSAVGVKLARVRRTGPIVDLWEARAKEGE